MNKICTRFCNRIEAVALKQQNNENVVIVRSHKQSGHIITVYYRD